ncbi:MAG TPA: DUF6600 domain-containing protein [Anaeromyxobacteraceae bacterium]
MTTLARTVVRLVPLAAALSIAPVAGAGDLPRRGAAVPRGGAEEKSSVSLEDFVEALGPWGTWKAHPRWGKVWRPGVDAEWRPYLRGRWAQTPEGWYWVSDEPWAWATYHFGRWFLEPLAGWTWVPGRRWAPSWVQWREGEALLGWAPLPPEGTAFGTSYTFVPRARVEGPAEQAAIPPTKLALALRDTKPIRAPARPQRVAVARER